VSIIDRKGISMHSPPSCPLRRNTAIGSLLAIALIVIAGDITIVTGVARDVIVAVGQHLVILGAIRRTQSAPMLNQDSSSVRSHRHRGAFPALKDNTAMRSVASGRIILY
jgi:hypothetical protein